jgi:hypothetical protein
MTLPQALGFLASALVLLTFGMRTMVPMRIAAIASNLAFIAYGVSLELTPVWLLHGILLPLNAYRLLEARPFRRRRRGRSARRFAARRRSLTARVPYAPPATTVGRRGWASSQTITSSAFRSGGNTG